MMKDIPVIDNLPVKVYKEVALPGNHKRRGSDTHLLLKFRVFLRDRPGSLATFSALIAGCRGNISFFHYDRSADSSRVVVEVRMSSKRDLDTILDLVRTKKYSFEKVGGPRDEVQITTLENVLEIRVRLVNRPGALAAFAQLLRRHHANVLYMFYDEDIDQESASIAMATKTSDEIDRLLDSMNTQGYYYRVIYRGSDKEEVDHIIGLKLVEKFFLRLRKLLSDSDTREVKALVNSSQELSADLVRFYTEAGDNLEAADVFEKVLSLASLSRSRLGRRFFTSEMPPLRLCEGVRLFGFRLPTSENIFVFEHGDELSMIDTGYGVYYDDIKGLLREKSWDPASLRRIFITHPDADHAGSSGYFGKEFGTKIYMHAGGKEVMSKSDRSLGLAGKLSNLNKFFTRLVNRFTNCGFPASPAYFSSSPLGKAGAFPVIDTFSVGPVQFEVLESLGGHIPGNVFFLSREYGLLFSADYLLNIKSLTAENKDALSVYKYLLISPNSNRAVFREEMDALQELMNRIHARLKKQGRAAYVFPGHGEYYSWEEAK